MAVVPRQAMVDCQLLAPGAPQARRLRHAPARLLRVKKCRAVLADLVRNHLSPRHPRAWGRTSIAQIRDEGQAVQRGRGGCLQCGHQGVHFLLHKARQCSVACGTLCRRLQMLALQMARLPLCRKPAARHGQARTTQSLQRGRSLWHGLVHPAPVGVDGDELVQRPSGRNAGAGPIDVLGECGHGVTPEAVGLRLADLVATTGSEGKGVGCAAGAGGAHRAKARLLNFSSRNNPP